MRTCISHQAPEGSHQSPGDMEPAGQGPHFRCRCYPRPQIYSWECLQPKLTAATFPQELPSVGGDSLT